MAPDGVQRPPLVDMHVARVEIVLADEDHRQLQAGRQIQTLVKASFLGGAVAEVGHGHLPAAAVADLQTGPHRMGDGRGHDGCGPRETQLRRDQMHGAAASPGTAGAAAEDLGHHFPQVATLGQVMAVRAMGAEDVVVVVQVRTHAHGHGFLPRVQVRRADDFLLQADDPAVAIVLDVALVIHGLVTHQVGDLFLGRTDAHHQAIVPDQFVRAQIR